jgi:ATP adenylyltransferase
MPRPSRLRLPDEGVYASPMGYLFNFDKMAYVRGDRGDACALCAIRDGDASVPDLSVRRTKHCVASVNLYPYNPGHLILFPTRHVLDLRELSEEERRDLDGLRDHCLDALDELYGASGYNIGFNMGFVAGASIDHIHMHIIPRYPREIGIVELVGGGRVLIEDPRKTQERLRELLSRLDTEG